MSFQNKLAEKGARIRAKLADLTTQFPSGDCVVVSMESDIHNTKGGAVMELPLELAARGVVDNTHRIATDEEVKLYKSGQAAAGAAFAASQPAKPTIYTGYRKGEAQ